MNSILSKVLNKEPVFFENNECLENSTDYLNSLTITLDDIKEAEARMKRFAPLINELFPETDGGIIESPFCELKSLKEKLYPNMRGSLFVKLDSHLEVAGSIKARGGIYEVMKITEDLLFENNFLNKNDDYRKIIEPKINKFLSKYTMSVASTGNLGLSIGIISACFGYNVRVHMSEDAKQWKKDRLTKKGVTVVEHKGDFTYAAKVAREEAELSEKIFFVDDEKSKNLFMGYAVSALRIKEDFKKNGIVPTKENPLYLYLPCGVGGAPGGITFGFKHIFKDAVKSYFAEPVSTPSMMLSIMTGKFGKLNVNDYGLDNKTDLDGLAVASPSDFVSPLMKNLCNGFYTVTDDKMFEMLYILKETEDIKIEPSAAAGVLGAMMTKNISNPGYHIIWTTGGLFVPYDIYNKMYLRGKRIYEENWD